MKLVQFTVAAFLSKSDRTNTALSQRARSTTELYLAMAPLPPAIDLKVEQIRQMPTGTVPGLITSEGFRPVASAESAAWSQFIKDWLLVPPAYAANAVEPPSKEDILLLNQAMDAYYKNDASAIDLLSQAIQRWKGQPADERAALYRVRADASMNQLQPLDAQQDYTRAIQLLTQADDDSIANADRNELPAAYLGRARATRTLTGTPSKEQSLSAAKDYQLSLRLSSRDDWDTNDELEEDGAARNPYAAWEWGTSLRNAGLYSEAARVHIISSQAFDDIGDKARAVISQIDAGIDLAADYGGTTSLDDAKSLLTKAIARTTSVEGRDVALLQRVIAKEGEGRIALASILWSSPEGRQTAEEQLGQACLRLEQLDQDAMERKVKDSNGKGGTPTKLKFSIDDQAGALDVSCSRFKNDKFLTDTLQWPASLQDQVRKLNSLQ